jgi:phosphatidylglycerophosphatase A
MFDKIQKMIATLGFVGFMPIAPGTWGTGIALIFVYILGFAGLLNDLMLILIGVPLFFIGTYAASRTEMILGKDSGHIVIDEFVGYMVTMLFLPKTLPWLIAGFFVFRFFDVVKPPPVRQAERAIKGGLGVMFDDVLAGIYSNIVLQLFRLIY